MKAVILRLRGVLVSICLSYYLSLVFTLCHTGVEPRHGASFTLLGFGVSILEGIDPNPDNFVSSGIVHTRNQQIGCLVRLEPNRAAEMYRLTVRSTKDSVATAVASLLETQF